MRNLNIKILKKIKMKGFDFIIFHHQIYSYIIYSLTHRSFYFYKQ